MPGGFYGSFLETVGIEFEGIGLSRNMVSERVLDKVPLDIRRQISVTHDASTEFYADMISTSRGGIFVSSHTKPAKWLPGTGRGNHAVFGYEIVTPPLKMNELDKVLIPMMFSLVENGDFVSDRASTHFHFGYVNNLRLLQNFLRVGLMIDPVLYRLGGMGRTFRGNINLAAYARPLTNSAATFIIPARKERNSEENREERMRELLGTRTSRRTLRAEPIPESPVEDAEMQVQGKYAQIINPIAALDATSLEEFWAAFGVAYRNGGAQSRYHACRYSGINLYSVPQHGTVEYRHFNQTQNPFLVIAIAKLLRGFVELAATVNKNEVGRFQIVDSSEELSVGDCATILQNLTDFCHEKEIEYLPTENEMSLILETIGQSHFKMLPETPVLTHLRDAAAVTSDLVALGKLKVLKKVLKPEFVDIHNIENRTVSILDEYNREGDRE